MWKIPVLLTVVSTLGACSLIDAATSDRPNSDQQNALGDTFVQLGTIAAIAAEPTSTSNDDLVTAMTFDHFARLIDPEAAAAVPGPVAFKPATLPPNCVKVDGDMRMLDCAVMLRDGRNCLITGDLRREARGPGSDYKGRVVLGGSGCPTGTADVDLYIEGATDDPNVASGSLVFGYDDPGKTSLSGTCVLDQVAITEKCPNVPARGTIRVSLDKGSVLNGGPVDGVIEMSFNESPGCGVILIE